VGSEVYFRAADKPEVNYPQLAPEARIGHSSCARPVYAAGSYGVAISGWRDGPYANASLK